VHFLKRVGAISSLPIAGIQEHLGHATEHIGAEMPAQRNLLNCIVAQMIYSRMDNQNIGDCEGWYMPSLLGYIKV
jgi:hypothetical protein